MANIFLSYNRKSEVMAKALADDIEKLGHTVWFDRELSGGQAWWDQILSRVRDCAVFVFVLDQASLNSAACKREYGYANDLGKPILPVLVAEGIRETLLPPALAKIQFVDYRNRDTEAVLRLARAVATVPPPEPLPNPLPEPPETPISYLGSLVEQIETNARLSYEDQSGLLIKLRRSFRDPETREDARSLLERLRNRDDLNGLVRDDIDELLASAKKVPTSDPVPPPPVSQPVSRVLKPLAKTLVPSILTDESLPEDPAAQSSVKEPVWTDPTHPRTIMERCVGAGIGVAASVAEFLVLVVLISLRGYENYKYYSLLDLVLFPLGGAIAGAISGKNSTRRIATLVAMAVVALFHGVVVNPVPYFLNLVTLFTPILGALVGVFIERKRA